MSQRCETEGCRRLGEYRSQEFDGYDSWCVRLRCAKCLPIYQAVEKKRHDAECARRQRADELRDKAWKLGVAQLTTEERKILRASCWGLQVS